MSSIDRARSTDRAVSRILLVADRRDTVAPRDPYGPKVRRYRLARLQLNRPVPARREERHIALRRLYD
jgi:hypothetical protein